jgi:hypothetical protein
MSILTDKSTKVIRHGFAPAFRMGTGNSLATGNKR